MTPPETEAPQYKKKRPKHNVPMVGLLGEDGQILLTRTAQLPQSWHAVGGGIESEVQYPKDIALCKSHD